MKKKRILTGDRPTGKLHIGHLCGSLKDRVALQDKYDTFVIIADVQALTDHFDHPEQVAKNVYEVAMDNLAVGINPEKSTLFIQSLIPEIAELTIYYANLVTVARLQRNPTVKEEISQKKDLFKNHVTYGFLGYPVSQAADITAFQANLVPVGEDQLPMIEQAQEIVRKFNRIYGKTLVEPKAKVGSIPRLKGLDGRKMSKSLNNYIALSDSPEMIREKIKTALTGKEGGENLLNIFKDFSDDQNQIAEFEKEYQNNTIQYSKLKPVLAESIIKVLAPIREKRAHYEQKPKLVKDILLEGTERAKKTAQETLELVKQKMHLNYF